MSSANDDKLSIGQRMEEERSRLGKTRAQMAEACDKTPQAIGEFERGVSFPGGAVLLGYAKAGADAQYILTGVRSTNIMAIAAGPTGTDKEVSAPLSKEEEALVEKYRRLGRESRAHAQAVVNALASEVAKKDQTGS